MQQYPQEKQYWEKNKSERALEKFEKEVGKLKEKLANNEGKPLSQDQKDKITGHLNLQLTQLRQIGNIESRLDRFCNPNPKLEERKMRWEKHYSRRLGKNMRLAGKPQPDKKCQPHAMIAGSDPAAGNLRGMLVVFELRVDDPVNGVWLPGYEDDIPHWAMPNSVCHAWLNHAGYHIWVEFQRFDRTLIDAADSSKKKIVIAKLQRVAQILQHERHSIPKSAIQTKDDTIKRKGGN